MSPRRFHAVIRAILVGLLLVVVAGCGGNKRINKANFDKIKEGTPRADVEAMLGQGESDEDIGLQGSGGAAAVGGIGTLDSVARPVGGTKWVKWGDDKKWIKVGFVGDRVGKGMIQQSGL